jgi:hypothetical protein
VLKPLVFEDGNLNRAGKRTKVKIEPPIGKYALYSRNIGGTDYLYMLTASAMLVQLGEAFRFKDITEQMLDDHCANLLALFEKQIADPGEWADFNAAAVAGRIPDAEAHNAPIREEREAEYAREAQVRRDQQETERQEREKAFSARVHDMESKILSGEKVNTELDNYKDKNPLFALFDKYGMDVPLATKGWVNRNLTAFQMNESGSVTMWLPRKIKPSSAFTKAVSELKEAIKKGKGISHSVMEQENREVKTVQTMNTPEHETQPPPTITLDMSLPDPTLSEADRNAYGYTAEDMLPLSAGRAAELFNTDHAVYLLYPDNTEAMAFDRSEILAHNGLCGIERAEWQRSPVRAAQLAIAANSEGSRESELLHSGDRCGIYQIRSGDDTRDYRFEAYAQLQDRGLAVSRGNYELVYTMPISDVFAPGTSREDLLDQIYETINASRPQDYTGRSVSVSDVLVLNYGDEVSSHYVDRFGFRELLSFTGAETPRDAETPTQESNSQLGNTPAALPPSSPTVAELEAEVKAGNSISLMDLSRAINAERKPTLAEQLAEGKRMAAAQSQNTAQKSTNREV